jgi:CubicO group peptidase (beta-lactamase class C family)
MKDTAFHVPPDKIDRFCANYQINADKRPELVDAPQTSEFLTPPRFYSCSGDPALVATTRDYLRFCEMLRRGGELDSVRILGPRTVEIMRRNHLKDGADLAQMAAIDFSALAWHGVGFGLGFGVTPDSVKRGRFGEGGFFWGGSAGTRFWVDPIEDLSVVCMVQLDASDYGFFDFEGPLTNMVYAAIED